MPRPLWKGYLSFGLVSVPCALAAMEAPENEISFTMLDRRDHSRIRYQRVNERTGKEVPWSEIVKGHEIAEGEYVIVKPEDFKRAAPKATRTVEILGFVKDAQIDPWFYEKPYVLQPLEGGEKGYRLLAEALEHSKQVGIATLVLHTRQHLAALVPKGSALVLNTMRYASEIRELSEFDVGDSTTPKARKPELDMALTLIKAMSIDFKPQEYKDEYRDALRKWIAKQAKSGGRAVPDEEDQEPAPAPYSIMEMLKRSIEGVKPSASPQKKSGRRAAG